MVNYVLKLQIDVQSNEGGSFELFVIYGPFRRASFVFDTTNFKSYEPIPVVSLIRHRNKQNI